MLWALLALIVAAIAVAIASFDIRERPLAGDESSHVLQALSLAGDANLSYDQRDLDRFADLEWPGAVRPNGIFFQRFDDGWAFAKPYGYSIVAAPFVRGLGAVPGLAVANAALFLAMVASAWVACRPAGRGVAGMGVLSIVASVTWLYGFSAHSDLFLATLMSATAAAASRAFHTRRLPWTCAAAALAAVALAEKPPFALVLVPTLFVLVLVTSDRRRDATTVLASCIVTFCLAVLPYLVYSDFTSWNPYSGERFYRSDGILPFDPEAPPLSDYRVVSTTESFEPGVVLDRLTEDPLAGARSFGLSFVGRHTGMLVFLPFTALMLVLGARRSWRVRPLTGAAVIGVIGYLALYAFVFPKNYFGGEQSLGNRYLVQVSPAALLALVVARPARRAVIRASSAGVALALLFLWPHFVHPTDAFLRLERTSEAQRLLPEESEVVGRRLFRCGIPAIMWQPFEPLDDQEARVQEQEQCLEIQPRASGR